MIGAAGKQVDRGGEIAAWSPALRDWLSRNAASAVGVVFALGFAWAQFSALQSGLADTRLELKELRDAFLTFRVGEVASQGDVDRATTPLYEADQRLRDELRHQRLRIEALTLQLMETAHPVGGDGS